MTDQAGADLFRAHLPSEWVPRPYHPDYGVDFDVETFERAANGRVNALGEHFFVQLKSQQRARHRILRVYGRYNVEKMPLREDKSDFADIDVLPVTVATRDLELSLIMGPAAPYLLVLCDLARTAVFYVCLTDYTEKIVLPRFRGLPTSKTHTVHLPAWNRISRKTADVVPLSFFAKRAKLYAAFNKFRYQRHEIGYLLDGLNGITAEEFARTDAIAIIRHFLQLIRRYDFWQTSFAWPAIELMWLDLVQVEERVTRFLQGTSPVHLYADGIAKLESGGFEASRLATFLLITDIRSLWDRLANLGNMFEEICREWHLPTRLAALAEDHALRG